MAVAHQWRATTACTNAPATPAISSTPGVPGVPLLAGTRVFEAIRRSASLVSKQTQICNYDSASNLKRLRTYSTSKYDSRVQRLYTHRLLYSTWYNISCFLFLFLVFFVRPRSCCRLVSHVSLYLLYWQRLQAAALNKSSLAYTCTALRAYTRSARHVLDESRRSYAELSAFSETCQVWVPGTFCFRAGFRKKKKTQVSSFAKSAPHYWCTRKTAGWCGYQVPWGRPAHLYVF